MSTPNIRNKIDLAIVWMHFFFIDTEGEQILFEWLWWLLPKIPAVRQIKPKYSNPFFAVFPNAVDCMLSPNVTYISKDPTTARITCFFIVAFILTPDTNGMSNFWIWKSFQFLHFIQSSQTIALHALSMLHLKNFCFLFFQTLKYVAYNILLLWKDGRE